jgi:hypothetical protein
MDWIKGAESHESLSTRRLEIGLKKKLSSQKISFALLIEFPDHLKILLMKRSS